MKKFTIILFLAIIPLLSFGQKYKSYKSYIKFFSSAPMEDIEAVNTEAVSIFNPESGEIAFSIPISGFQFDKSLMQEHFNENYLESDKYPTATFQGKISGYNLNINTLQESKAVGIMKIHGVEKEVEIQGELLLGKDKLILKSVFPISVADYEIEIPKVVFYNIAEIVEVTVDFEFKRM